MTGRAAGSRAAGRAAGGKSLMARRFGKGAQGVVVVLLFFLVWEAAVRITNANEAFISAPSAAIAHLLFKQPDANYHWGKNILATFYEFALGFVVTGFVGTVIGIVIGWSKTIQKAVMPLFVMFNSIPMVAVAPILLIWMGYGLKTNVLIAFLVSFFPMVINTVAGLKSVDGDLLDLVRYLNGSKWQLFRKIRLPNALPFIFSALKICTTLSVMGVIVGELIASDRGLGYVIINAQMMMDTPPLFASLIMISLLGWGMYLVVSAAERLVMPWAFVDEVV
ncbi:MAG TPA: ABC transporter permease [Candidatus Limnocylindria bacterium]|nr:ABC transporter permease [Candidatus Limnocylindria bacterium]